MDYLDPRKRKANRIRLMVGYALMAVVIGLATLLIVYGANGYGLNTKTGQIVQNSLLFADSFPGSAEIYLNGKDQHAATASRLIVPAGSYDLSLQKNGYRTWERKFSLAEQSVGRYVYPFLFPVKPVSSSLKTYPSNPSFITESPDRKWLLVQTGNQTVPEFDQYDTTTLDQTTPSVTALSFPSLLTKYSSESKLSEVEWASDNNRLLVKHEYPGGGEFILLDRIHPEESFNLNKTFNIDPIQANLRDKKTDQFYLLTSDDLTLRVGDTASKQLLSPILKKVLAYKPYGKNIISFVTDVNAKPDMVISKIWDNGQVYKLTDLPTGSRYLVDSAQFQGHFYFVAGSDASDRINIYKDPLSGLQNPALSKALPLIAIHGTGWQKLSFSDNARFVAVENGQKFGVYDIETQNSYQYQIAAPPAGDLTWMDGHRLIGLIDNQVEVMDYDGINQQQLAPSTSASGGFFSRDFNHLLVTSLNQDGNYSLQNVDMRAGVDLPKK